MARLRFYILKRVIFNNDHSVEGFLRGIAIRRMKWFSRRLDLHAIFAGLVLQKFCKWLEIADIVDELLSFF